MAKKVFANRAKMTTSTTGTGVLTLDSAVAGFQSFEAAGVVTNDEVRYVIEDGDNWEVGLGTFTDGGLNTLTRSVLESTNADQAINLSGSAVVFIATAAEDFVQIDGDVMTGNLGLADDVKLEIGTNQDLEIYHDGSNTLINERGTGSLKFQVGGVDVATVTADGISADIVGDLTGNVVGNADSATALATSRSITLVGDVSGTASFNGTADITITATVADNSHNHDNATTFVDGFMSAADKTKLDGIEALADITDETNVTAAGAVMDSELTNITAVKALDQGVATTDSPSFVNLDVNGYVDLQPMTSPAYAEGRLFYDSEHKTLNVFNDETETTLEIGQEERVRAYNNSGATILKGRPVYWNGENAGHPIIGLGNATDENKYNVQGLSSHDIENNSYGYVTVSGMVRDFDTSGLTAGAAVFLGLTDGALQNASPMYPNYPMSLGYVVTSDATLGEILVNQQNHSVNSFRVRNSAHVGNNLIVDGNLTVNGTQTIASSQNIAIGGAFSYLNAGDTIGANNTAFTGTGLDDANLVGHYEGTTVLTYYVRIDGNGTPDTFEWSKDNFSTTEATGVAITGAPQALDNNIFVEFASTTSHTIGNVWSGAVAPVNVDTGMFTNRNTGASGVGYTHMGVFYDVSANKWTMLDQYGPEPDGTIDLLDPSVVYGTLKVASLEGNLVGNVSGNVTGNASTASALATGRLISLSGDVTGSVTFNGSQNVSITAAVVNDSHSHSVSTLTGLGSLATLSTVNADTITDSSVGAAELNVVGNGTSTQFLRSDGDGTFTWAVPINTTYSDATTSVAGLMSSADKTKLDTIETGANVTDTANVVAALSAGNNISIAGNGVISATDTNTTYTAGSGLVLVGTTFSHSDTSAVGSVDNTGATVIQDITVDGFGHVTGIGSTTLTAAAVGAAATSHTHVAANITDLQEYVEDRIGAAVVAGSNVSVSYNDTTGQTTISSTDTNTTYAAGAGLALAGTTFSHTDTSTQATVSNSGRTYIQGITLDTYGHITGISSATETVVNTDTNTTYTAGTGMSLNGTTFNCTIVNTDTNTTYTAGTGMQLSGTTFNCLIDSPAEVGLGNLSSNGNALAGNFTATGNITAYSDVRLKSNIQTIESGLDKICAMRGVTFEKDGVAGLGVIAQEVEAVIPEVVMTHNDGIKSVAYGNIVGVLIEAIKEQQLQINSLKEKIGEINGATDNGPNFTR